MRTAFAIALICFAAAAHAAPDCHDSYEGGFIPQIGEDRFLLTCWPVKATESTDWRRLDGDSFDPGELNPGDVLKAVGCLEEDGFTLVADEIVLVSPAPGPEGSEVQVVMGVDSTPAWIVLASTDPRLGWPGFPNFPLKFEIGLRYTIVNANAGHAFQLIAGDFAIGNDVVVLSQGDVVGTMEDDPGVAWVDNGDEIAFTLTPELAVALEGNRAQQPGYRSGLETQAMHVPVTLFGASGVEDWQSYE